MELSVSAWCVQKELFSGRMTLSDFISLCAIKQIQYVELLDCFFTDDDHITATQTQLAGLGMSVSAYSVANDFVKSAVEREAEIDSILQGVDIAVRLGATKLRVFSGDKKEGIAFEDAQAGIIEALRSCAAYAGARGVTLVLENHGLLAGKSGQIIHIIAEVGSEYLKANADTGNFLLVGEKPAAAIEALGNRIGFVHFKDLRRVSGESGYLALDGSVFQGTVIGKGEIDMPGVVAALRAVGYDGFISLEFEGEENQVEGTRESIDFVRSIL